MQESGQIETLAECNDAKLESLPTGQFLEVAVTGGLIAQDRQMLQIQDTAGRMNEALARAKEYQRQVEPMLKVANEFGLDLGDDPQFDRNLKAIERLSAVTIPQAERPAKFAVVATLIGYARPTFVIPVRTETLQRSPEELDGEYLVFAKVFRRALAGEVINPAEFSGMPNPNRAERRRAKAKSSNLVDGPALVLEPIAIYR